MKRENTVASLEQAKKLKELGIINPSPEYYWVDESAWQRGYQVQHKSNAEYKSYETKGVAFTDFDSTIPTFTVAELIEMLTEEVAANLSHFTAVYLAHVLIGLLENTPLTPEEVNQRLQNS